jgi:hypothetical protein
MGEMLLRRDDPLKFNPLEDMVMDDIAPSVWSGPHVGKRLAEAMRTLRMLPMGGIAGYVATWPPYSCEWQDLLAQNEKGELEKTMRSQNRVRLLPSYSDVTPAAPETSPANRSPLPAAADPRCRRGGGTTTIVIIITRDENSSGRNRPSGRCRTRSIWREPLARICR